MPLFGPPNVEKLKAKRDVKRLIKALQYPEDYRVRDAAARALGAIGDPRAIEPLVTAMNNTGAFSPIPEALAKIGGPRTVELLIESLSHSNFLVVLNAVSALGRIGDVRAVKPLTARLGDPDHSLHYYVVDALRDLAHPDPWGPLRAATASSLEPLFRRRVERALGAIAKRNLDTVFPAVHRIDLRGVDYDASRRKPK